MNRVLDRVREVVLTVGAVGGLLCIALAIGSVAFGLRPLIVQSGSMAPTIKTGALLVARDTPVSKLRVGDVVTVKRHDHSLVTHRIVRITPQGNHSTLTLKGDANKVPDPELYTVKRAGVKLFAIPFAGRVAAAVGSPVGIFLLGIYVAFLIAVVVNDWRGRSRGQEKRPKGGGRKKSRNSVAAGCGLLMLSAALVAPLAPKSTFAAWTDSASVGTATLSTFTVPVPQNFRCGTLGVLSVQFQWNAVTGATNYTLHYGSNGATTMTVTGTSQTITAAISGGTAWVNANINYGSTTWTSANSNTRSYTVAAVSLCA